ncbi:MAG: hypothetical protein WBH98_08745, partial [Bacteroidales bacterium]
GEVLIQKGAGLGSSISDAEFSAQGVRILEAADDVWAEAEMVIKVKEPIAQEYHRLREGLVVFTYPRSCMSDRRVRGVKVRKCLSCNGILGLTTVQSS